jgi:hypothetical protein
VARYTVNPDAVEHARALIRSRQYVLDSDWGTSQPRAEAENAYLERHSWDEYAAWHLALTEGATDETKARYAFAYGDLRRLHRTGLIACLSRLRVAAQRGRAGSARPVAGTGRAHAALRSSPRLFWVGG